MPAVLLVIAALMPSGNPTTRFEFEEPHMGTKVRIVLYSANQLKADSAAKAAFARIAELEQVLSDYRPESEIMKLCRANDLKPGKAHPISDDLAKIMEIALEISKKSEGAFDVTIGPLSQLWRESRKSKQLPKESMLQETRAKVGWKMVALDAKSKTLMLEKSGMRLDFGGIGKGFAADAAIAVLKKHGVDSALVAISGDIAVSEAPPGRDGWIVDVAPLNPNDEPRKLSLSNAAVSTSGDLFQHLEIDGVRYSHVLDPKTGLGLKGFRCVTVVAKLGVHADAFAKVASVLAPDKAIKLIEEAKGATFLVVRENASAKPVTTQSSTFEKYLLK